MVSNKSLKEMIDPIETLLYHRLFRNESHAHVTFHHFENYQNDSNKICLSQSRKRISFFLNETIAHIVFYYFCLLTWLRCIDFYEGLNVVYRIEKRLKKSVE